MTELKTYYGNELHLKEILTTFSADVINVNTTEESMYRYYYGTKYITGDTSKIYYLSQKNDNNTAYTIAVILPEYILNYLFSCAPGCNEYTQVRFMVDNKYENVAKSYSGKFCYHRMIQLLNKYYTDKEIDDILHSYDKVEYNKNLKQVHYNFEQLPMEMDYILKIDNCYKYDINGAHQEALSTMFPKAKPLFEQLEKDKLKPDKKAYVKALFNLTVGYMKKEGFVGAYNWIVQRTTTKLLEAIKYCDGELLYANTDGFLVKDPKHLINNSNVLGEFKQEYKGSVYYYSDKNYFAFECKDKIEGNSLLEIRQNLRLSEGKVIHYTREQQKLEYGAKTSLSGAFKATNIKKEILEIRSYQNGL